MKDFFVISDLHIGHKNIIKFADENGVPHRPFDDLEQMHAHMIKKWNEVVTHRDTVWVLGDVAMCSDQITDRVLSQLNGNKNLVLGNHDSVKSSVLKKHFNKMVVSRRIEKYFLLTHYPIALPEFNSSIYNVHGHIHHNDSPTTFHYNVSVEKLNYRPIRISKVIEKLKRINE